MVKWRSSKPPQMRAASVALASIAILFLVGAMADSNDEAAGESPPSVQNPPDCAQNLLEPALSLFLQKRWRGAADRMRRDGGLALPPILALLPCCCIDLIRLIGRQIV
jgi:hypothetical protein